MAFKVSSSQIILVILENYVIELEKIFEKKYMSSYLGISGESMRTLVH